MEEITVNPTSADSANSGRPYTRTGSAQFHLMSAAFGVTVQVPVTTYLPVPPDTEAEVARRHTAGESQDKIASGLGLHRSTIRRVLTRLGVPVRAPRPSAKKHHATILNLHVGGKTIGQITDTLGVSFTTVFRVLRREGKIQAAGE